jgi:hypothetical protein
MTKIGTVENKVHMWVIEKFIIICWLKFLLYFFSIHFFFSHHVSYIESL